MTFKEGRTAVGQSADGRACDLGVYGLADALEGPSIMPGGDRPDPLEVGEGAIADLRDALFCARVVAFSHIRAALLDRVLEAFNGGATGPLALEPWFRDAVGRAEPGWRRAVASAIEGGVPVPVLSASLAYLDGLRQERSPANLIQGMRDAFGAHGYRRIDSDEDRHGDWTGAGSDAQ